VGAKKGTRGDPVGAEWARLLGRGGWGGGVAGAGGRAQRGEGGNGGDTQHTQDKTCLNSHQTRNIRGPTQRWAATDAKKEEPQN